MVGTIAIGDVNVHSQRWLRLSSGESTEGTALFRACQNLCAQQMVHEPTRGPYLLDLVLADIDGVKAKVVPGVSDHEIVIASLKLGVPECETVRRTVWQYKDGDWDRLRDTLTDADWSFINSVSTSEAAQRLTDIILEQARDRAPVGRKEDVSPLVDCQSCRGSTRQTRGPRLARRGRGHCNLQSNPSGRATCFRGADS